MRRLSAVVTVLFVLVIAGAPSAGAASWSTVATPIAENAIAATSCFSSTVCMAVGTRRDLTEAVNRPFAQSFNGSTWRTPLAALPNPEGSTESVLNGISCPTSSECIAVGSSTNARGEIQTMAVRWNGTEWNLQSTPSAGGSSNRLNGISCTSASFCIAVGRHVNIFGRDETLLQTWNGREWTIQRWEREALEEAATEQVGFNAVSCSSESACTAVGYRRLVVAGPPFPLVIRWNGRAWTSQFVEPPASSREAVMYGVSCKTSTACTAVGSYQERSGAQRDLVYGWAGAGWTLQSAAAVAFETSSRFTSVSCVAAAECVAAGQYTTSTETRGLAQKWNGREWVNQAVPATAGVPTLLGGVSCLSSAFCLTDGSWRRPVGNTMAYAAKWSGASWATNLPAGPASDTATDVSCASSTSCVVVGRETRLGSVSRPLARRLSGTSWSFEPLPGTGTPSDVSCTSTRWCMTVGSGTWAAGWNGTEWSLRTLAAVEGGSSQGSEAVSCTSEAACTMVGPVVLAGANRFYIERWNGFEWLMQEAPLPREAEFARLHGVSCSTASACTAVGEYKVSGGAFRPFALGWNGGAWSLQEPPPLPEEASEGTLLSVSCTEARACTAVGRYSVGGTSFALAERWNGTSWERQSIRESGRIFNAVSCDASNDCHALGNDTAVPNLLVEYKWNGTEWTRETIRWPISVALVGNDIACTSATFCIGTGSAESTSVIEQYS